MKRHARSAALFLLLSCLFLPPAYAQNQTEAGEAALPAAIDRSGKLNEMLEQSGALEGVARADAQAFRDRLLLAITRLIEAERNNVFEGAGQTEHAIAIRLAKACIAGRVESENVGEAMAVIAIGVSLPREIVAEGLLRAIADEDDPARISTPYNDLMRYVYAQDGPGQPMDIDLITTELRKADGRLPEKIIVHLLAYDADRTFRSILEAQHKAIDEPARLSWFDRRLQESRWAARHSVDLGQAFKDQLRADFHALFKHETWWVRLYAVELVRDRSMSVDPEVLRELADDENRYVKARAISLQNRDD